MAKQNRPQGAVELALEKQLFGRFTTKSRSVDVGVAAINLLPNSPERIGWALVNTAGQQLTFAPDSIVVSGAAFTLINNGDTCSVTYLEDGQFPTHEISIIAAAAGGRCYIVEFIRDSL